jgi:hypothetical protein
VFAGMAVTVDRSNPDDPVIRAEGQGKAVTLPVNRNVMIVGDEAIALEGVSVFIDRNERAWVPMEAGVKLGLTAAPLPSVTLAAN